MTKMRFASSRVLLVAELLLLVFSCACAQSAVRNQATESSLCGAATRYVSPTEPTANLCATGATPSAVVGGSIGPWSWTCTNQSTVVNACWATPFFGSQMKPLYSQWPVAHAVLDNPYFFPISVWLQDPHAPGGPNHATVADSAADEYVNIFLGLDGWPESYGSDNGELAAIKKSNLYLIGGLNVPYDYGSSHYSYMDPNDPANDDPEFGHRLSIDSILSLAKKERALAHLIGYNAGDEPTCDGNAWPGPGVDMGLVPDIVSGIHSYDNSRLVTFNTTAWETSTEYLTNNIDSQNPQCWSAAGKALQATDVGSFDLYPVTTPYVAAIYTFFDSSTQLSDFETRPNDTLWLQGLTVQQMVSKGRAGQPMWAFVETGNDTGSWGWDDFQAGVTEGSNVLTYLGPNTGPNPPSTIPFAKFTDIWVGLNVDDGVASGFIPIGTTITSVIDSTHVVMSQAATGTNSDNDYVMVTGNAAHGIYNTDCLADKNLCVVNGNELEATASQVNAEVWSSIINGANGIEYYCHHDYGPLYSAPAFCFGNAWPGGNGDGYPSPEEQHLANSIAANLQYINATILSFAPVLNAPTVGICTMQQLVQTPTAVSYPMISSCSGGILAMASSNTVVPGMAMAKQLNGLTYFFAQSDRRSAAGATFTFSLEGLGGKTARIIYDSDTQYDPSNSSLGATIGLDGSGLFSDVLGANGDDYQVKIYAIQ